MLKKEKNKDLKISKVYHYETFSDKSYEFFLVKKFYEIPRLPSVSQFFYVLTKNNNSITDFLDLCQNVKYCVLFCSRINKKSYDKIKPFLKNIYISDRVEKLNPEIFNEIENKTVLKNHSKIFLVKTDQDYFVFAGSGNASINARNENYLIFNDKDLFKNLESCLKK
jgi:hypothetical protein